MKIPYRKIICFFVAFSFLLQSVGFAQMAPSPFLVSSVPGNLPALRYVSVNSANPSNYFNFLLDKGNVAVSAAALSSQAQELIHYFFLGLTLPDASLWVNLRPDEPGRITSEELAKTTMGKVLLEQDLLLKKDVAKLLHPRSAPGKKFWSRLYEGLGVKKIRRSEVSISNRVWITPKDAEVVETEDGAFVFKASLQVLSEAEYLKIKTADQDEGLSNKLFKEIVVPELTARVNTAKEYAPLRQIYQSLILAQWYKQKHQTADSVYARAINKGEIANLQSSLPWAKQDIWQEYMASYEKGEYDTKETVTGLSRQYCTGGVVFPWNTLSEDGKTSSPVIKYTSIAEIAPEAAVSSLRGVVPIVTRGSSIGGESLEIHNKGNGVEQSDQQPIRSEAGNLDASPGSETGSSPAISIRNRALSLVAAVAVIGTLFINPAVSFAKAPNQESIVRKIERKVQAEVDRGDFQNNVRYLLADKDNMQTLAEISKNLPYLFSLEEFAALFLAESEGKHVDSASGKLTTSHRYAQGIGQMKWGLVHGLSGWVKECQQKEARGVQLNTVEKEVWKAAKILFPELSPLEKMPTVVVAAVQQQPKGMFKNLFDKVVRYIRAFFGAGTKDVSASVVAVAQQPKRPSFPSLVSAVFDKNNPDMQIRFVALALAYNYGVIKRVNEQYRLGLTEAECREGTRILYTMSEQAFIKAVKGNVKNLRQQKSGTRLAKLMGMLGQTQTTEHSIRRKAYLQMMLQQPGFSGALQIFKEGQRAEKVALNTSSSPVSSQLNGQEKSVPSGASEKLTESRPAPSGASSPVGQIRIADEKGYRAGLQRHRALMREQQELADHAKYLLDHLQFERAESAQAGALDVEVKKGAVHEALIEYLMRTRGVDRQRAKYLIFIDADLPSESLRNFGLPYAYGMDTIPGVGECMVILLGVEQVENDYELEPSRFATIRKRAQEIIDQFRAQGLWQVTAVGNHHDSKVHRLDLFVPTTNPDLPEMVITALQRQFQMDMDQPEQDSYGIQDVYLWEKAEAKRKADAQEVEYDAQVADGTVQSPEPAFPTVPVSTWDPVEELWVVPDAQRQPVSSSPLTPQEIERETSDLFRLTTLISLKAALRSTDKYVRVGAAVALGVAGVKPGILDRETIQLLEAGRNDKDADFRAACVDAVNAITHPQDGLSEADMASLLDVFGGGYSDTPESRASVMVSATKSDTGALVKIKEGLKSDRSEEREIAALAIAKIPDSIDVDTMAVLQAGIADSDPRIRYLFAAALGKGVMAMDAGKREQYQQMIQQQLDGSIDGEGSDFIFFGLRDAFKRGDVQTREEAVNSVMRQKYALFVRAREIFAKANASVKESGRYDADVFWRRNSALFNNLLNIAPGAAVRFFEHYASISGVDMSGPARVALLFDELQLVLSNEEAVGLLSGIVSGMPNSAQSPEKLLEILRLAWASIFLDNRQVLRDAAGERFASADAMTEFVGGRLLQALVQRLGIADVALNVDSLARWMQHKDPWGSIVAFTSFYGRFAREADADTEAGIIKAVVESILKGTYTEYRYSGDQLAFLDSRQQDTWEENSASDNVAVDEAEDSGLGKPEKIQEGVREMIAHGHLQDAVLLSILDAINTNTVFARIEELRTVISDAGQLIGKSDLGGLRRFEYFRETATISDAQKRLLQLRTGLEILMFFNLSAQEIGAGRLVVRGKTGQADKETKINKFVASLMSKLEQLGEASAAVDLRNILENIIQRKSGYSTKGAFSIVDTDDPSVIVNIGKNPVATCQAYDYPDVQYIRCLPAYLADANKKVIMVMRDGVPVARAVIRLMKTRDGKPVIFLEHIYSSTGTTYARYILEHLLTKKAIPMGIPVVTLLDVPSVKAVRVELSDINYLAATGKSRNSREYADAAQGWRSGEWALNKSMNLVTPLPADSGTKTASSPLGVREALEQFIAQNGSREFNPIRSDIAVATNSDRYNSRLAFMEQVGGLIDSIPVVMTSDGIGKFTKEIVREIMENAYDGVASYYDAQHVSETGLQRPDNYRGVIRVSFTLDENENVIMTVVDNGMGKNAAGTVRKRQGVGFLYGGGAGEGSGNVGAYAARGGGTYSLDLSDRGAKATVTFPLGKLALKNQGASSPLGEQEGIKQGFALPASTVINGGGYRVEMNSRLSVESRQELQRLAEAVTTKFNMDDFSEEMGVIVGEYKDKAYMITRFVPISAFEEGTTRQFLIASREQIVRIIETQLAGQEKVLGLYHNHSYERLMSNQRPGPSKDDFIGEDLDIPGYEDRIATDRIGIVIEPELDLGAMSVEEVMQFDPATANIILYAYVSERGAAPAWQMIGSERMIGGVGGQTIGVSSPVIKEFVNEFNKLNAENPQWLTQENVDSLAASLISGIIGANVNRQLLAKLLLTPDTEDVSFRSYCDEYAHNHPESFEVIRELTSGQADIFKQIKLESLSTSEQERLVSIFRRLEALVVRGLFGISLENSLLRRIYGERTGAPNNWSDQRTKLYEFFRGIYSNLAVYGAIEDAVKTLRTYTPMQIEKLAAQEVLSEFNKNYPPERASLIGAQVQDTMRNFMLMQGSGRDYTPAQLLAARIMWLGALPYVVKDGQTVEAQTEYRKTYLVLKAAEFAADALGEGVRSAVTSSPVAKSEAGNEGGIDLGGIKVTIQNSAYMSSLNPADVKIMRAARAVEDGWDSLAELYMYEVKIMLDDKIVQDMTQGGVMREIVRRLSTKGILDQNFTQSFILLQAEAVLSEKRLALAQ